MLSFIIYEVTILFTLSSVDNIRQFYKFTRTL